MTIPKSIDGELMPVNEQLMAVRVGDEWGFARHNGDIVWPAMYDAYIIFFYGLIAVQFDGQWGFLNEAGLEIVEPQYESVDFDLDRPLIHVVREERHGFINRRAEEVIVCQYGHCTEFTEDGFALYGDVNGKCGILCADGRELTLPIYDSVNLTIDGQSPGLFAVERNELQGFVNIVGEEVIPCRYDQCQTLFNTTHLLVQQNEQWAIIDQTHRFYSDFVFTDWSYTHVSGALLLAREGRWGLVTDTGDEELIPFCYDAIHELRPGIFAGLDEQGQVQGHYIRDRPFITPDFCR